MTIPASRLPAPKRSRKSCVRARGRGRAGFPGFVSVLFAILLFAPAGFADEGTGDHPPPEASASEERAVQEFVLWPFVVVEQTPSWRQFAVRPFYVERSSKDGSEKKVQFLWPLYLYRRSEEDVTIRIFPFYTYWRDVYTYRDREERETEYMLLPFVFGGSSTEEGGYFAVFPIAGTVRNFLGRDEISFLLFPVYMTYTKNELHQRNYLWPVLSFSGGGDYSGFRIWPLYGYFEKQGEYRKEFVLWPIYSHQTFDLDREVSGERLMFFPFYAREDSVRRRYRAVIWPFFTHEENFAQNFEEYARPWPFVVIARGSVYRTQLWPLYGYKQTEDRESRFVLWPFWHRWISVLDDDSKEYKTLLFPVMSSRTKISESEGVINHKFRLWPLWRFRRDENGSTRFRMLSLLWFDDEQGFERQYSPLWTIYERETQPEGTSQTYALWRLFRHTHAPTRSQTHVPLLFYVDWDAEQDSARAEILAGLFGRSRTGDERRLRILYFINIPY